MWCSDSSVDRLFDGVCGEVIYIFGTWTGVLKSEWYWKVSKFVIEVLNEFEM